MEKRWRYGVHRDKNKLRDISFPLFVRGDIIYRERQGWISRVTNSLSNAMLFYSDVTGANQWSDKD